MTLTVTRTQDEIVARTKNATDFFGFGVEALIPFLDFEHAKQFLKPEVTADTRNVMPAEALDAEASNYLAFAIGKARDHRGISAGRSVTKLTEYAWLGGRDDIVAAMEAADYPQYGVPMLKAFSALYPDVWSTNTTPEIERMAEGQPCTDDCEMGCGS